MKNETLRIFFILSIGVYALVMVIAPMTGEDFGLTRMFYDESIWERANYSFYRSIIQASGWNARLGEQLAIFFLSMPGYFYYLSNLLSLIAIIITISYIIKINREERTTYLMVSFSSIFAFWPGMEVFFWRTANAGYMVPSLFCLVALMPFISDDFYATIKKNYFTVVGYGACCFLSGVSFENVPVAIAMSMVLSVVLKLRTIKFAIAPVILTIAGWMILVTAHSTTVRREYYGGGANYADPSYIKSRVLDVLTVFYDTSSMLLFITAISIGYLAFNRKITRSILVLIFCSVLVSGSLVASPYTEPRAFLIAWLMMFAVVSSAIYTLFVSKAYKISFVIFAISLATSLDVCREYHKYAQEMNSREIKIKEAIALKSCSEGVKIYLITPSVPYRYINNRDGWYYNNEPTVSGYYSCTIKSIK